jgi:hypothetical protein
MVLGDGARVAALGIAIAGVASLAGLQTVKSFCMASSQAIPPRSSS